MARSCGSSRCIRTTTRHTGAETGSALSGSVGRTDEPDVLLPPKAVEPPQRHLVPVPGIDDEAAVRADGQAGLHHPAADVVGIEDEPTPLESRRPSTLRRETLVAGTEERSDVRAHRTTRARIRPPLVSLRRSSAGEGSAGRLHYSMLGALGFPDGDELQR